MAHSMILAELIGSLSYALDLTEGQPEGHCVRSCWIGLSLARHLALDEQTQRDIYYAILLKDLGCSSNAARISELYLADDRLFKHDFKLVGEGTASTLGFLFSHIGRGSSLKRRAESLWTILRHGKEITDQLIETRCYRGADIARQLRFNETVACGIQSLDEHWDGSGRPLGVQGEAIPLASRFALLAQLVDVFHVAGGREVACAEIARRAGSWLDPRLVNAFTELARDEAFWATLESNEVDAVVFACEPGKQGIAVDDDYLDAIAEGFGQVIDSKSPFTGGHSQRVALYADKIAERLGVVPERRRWLKRGALLHDVGKLGVSNRILDKPGRLTEEEWVAVKRHAAYTEEILGRIPLFSELAHVAGAHHERLDGGGYPRGLHAGQIALETRIITTADIFDAISAERPYHPANSIEQTLDIMRQHLGSAIDATCFSALEAVLASEASPTWEPSTLQTVS